MTFPRRGYIKPGGKKPSDGWTVGANGTGKHKDYVGPRAEVTWDAKDGWLYISTDPYEGTAMLNIEALPFLRRALARIAREVAAKRKAEGVEAGPPSEAST